MNSFHTAEIVDFETSDFCEGWPGAWTYLWRQVQQILVGAEMAAIRKAAKLSQIGLPRAVGIGRHAMRYWERQPKVNLPAWAVKRMIKVLPLPIFRTSTRAHASWTDSEKEHLSLFPPKFKQTTNRRVRCGAKTRKGTPCRMKPEPGKRRCKFHGGRSTGARTPDGIERIREAQRRRWAKWRTERTLETTPEKSDQD